MGNLRKNRLLPDMIPAIIPWGCIGGICLAAMIFFLQAVWAPILDYNISVSLVEKFQTIGSSFILFCTLGMTASDLFCTGRKNEPGPVFTGLLSGITTAFVFSSIYVLLSRPYLFSWDNGILEVNTGLKLIEWLILFTVFGITSGTLQATGAWYRHSRQESKPDKADVREKPTFSGMLYTYRFLILILLALLVIPPVMANIGIETGDIKWNSGFNRPFEYAEVSRTTDGSIMIFMKHDILSPQRCPGLRFVNITVDGKDVSTQPIIAGSGLNLSIDPPGGLEYRDNSSAIISGGYLSGNNTVLVRVNVTYTDLGFRDVIYYDTV
jgi:hypothetical protein